MEVTPEMWMNTEAVELYGPGAIQTPQQQLANQAESSSAPEPSQDIFAVQQQLLQAEAQGNHLAVQQLSMRLDDMLSGMTAAPKVDAEGTTDEPSGRASERSETPESPSEDDEIDLRQSDLFQQINEAHGPQKADEVHSWMNDNLSESELGDYMSQLQAGDAEALQAFQAAKSAIDQGVQLSAEVEASAFDDNTAFLIEDRFGANGTKIVQLNQQVASGAISQSQLKRMVISDPSLLADAIKAKAAGLISF